MAQDSFSQNLTENKFQFQFISYYKYILVLPKHEENPFPTKLSISRNSYELKYTEIGLKLIESCIELKFVLY